MSLTKVEMRALEIAGLREGLEIATDERAKLQAAFDYVLPFVHLDVRDKALQIARGEGQPGEKQ